MLNDVEFRDLPELTKVDRVKIVACDAKASVQPPRAEDHQKSPQQKTLKTFCV